MFVSFVNVLARGLVSTLRRHRLSGRACVISMLEILPSLLGASTSHFTERKKLPKGNKHKDNKRETMKGAKAGTQGKPCSLLHVWSSFQFPAT